VSCFRHIKENDAKQMRSRGHGILLIPASLSFQSPYHSTLFNAIGTPPSCKCWCWLR